MFSNRFLVLVFNGFGIAFNAFAWGR
jgi:hypothetical protein